MKPPRGLFHGEHPSTRRNTRYKATGEYRPPRKNEFFLSGTDEQGKPTAYRAPNDLTYIKYWIAVPVELITCPVCNGVGKIENPSRKDTRT